MRPIATLSALFVTCAIFGQSALEPGSQSTAQLGSEIPVATTTFSEPKLDSALQFPSSAIGGSLRCDLQGRSFITFLGPPPLYNNQTIYSLDSKGKLIHYLAEQVTGLLQTHVVFFDPGINELTMLLRAQEAAGTRGEVAYFLARFGDDGALRDYARLGLPFEPLELIQLYDDGYLTFGIDRVRAKPRFVIIDSRGTIRRDLTESSVFFSEKDATTMLDSLNFGGISPKDLPPATRLTLGLTAIQPIHVKDGVLLLEPGTGLVIHLNRVGEANTITLKLPQHQFAQSLIADKSHWFVRTSVKDDESASYLYQADPETGKAIKFIDLGVVPATSIACPTKSGFYGLRWIDKKPYLIEATFR